MTTERMPPRLSTGSVDSLTWAGTNFHTRTRAITAGGTAMRKTDPHQNHSRSAPAMTGPSTAPPLPMPDHRAIALTLARVGPHRAVIRASVVG